MILRNFKILGKLLRAGEINRNNKNTKILLINQRKEIHNKV